MMTHRAARRSSRYSHTDGSERSRFLHGHGGHGTCSEASYSEQSRTFGAAPRSSRFQLGVKITEVVQNRLTQEMPIIQED